MTIRRHNRHEYSSVVERKPFDWSEGLDHTPATLGPPPD